MHERITTACPLDCPDSCALEIEVNDGNLVSLHGSEEDALTAGFICQKVRQFAKHLDCPERLHHPWIREGRKGEGQFRRATWDEALEQIAGEMIRCRDIHGGESILPFSYGGSNGLLSQDTADLLLFSRLGASRLKRTVCAAPSTRAATGLYGKMPGVALTDYEHARLIVIWGMNPSASGIHLVPVIARAREKGAKLVVIDPRRTPLAAQADLHLPVRPGTDLPLALALHRWLFEGGYADMLFLEEHANGWAELRERSLPWTLEKAAEICGLPLGDVETFARLYQRAEPAVIRCGWGLERNRNGGSAVAAVIALPAVAGKFGVRGGGYTMSQSGAFRFADSSPEWSTHSINMNLLGRELLERRDPPVKMLFNYNCNPLATMPNQEVVRRGLAREDLFTVVFDQVMTDTAKYADVILPATTFLEHRDLAKGYGNLVLHPVNPVLEARGEARSNVEVFSELIRRLDLRKEGDPTTAEEYQHRVLSEALDSRDLARELAEQGRVHPPMGATPITFVDNFPWTEDRKIHLLPQVLDEESPEGLYVFRELKSSRLTLISPASRKRTSSTFGQLDRRMFPLEMNPEDAEARDLKNGIEVRVFNALGEVRVPLKVTDRICPGTVVLEKGLWSHHTLNGATANALAPDHLADLGGGACFNDARVEVEAV